MKIEYVEENVGYEEECHQHESPSYLEEYLEDEEVEEHNPCRDEGTLVKVEIDDENIVDERNWYGLDDIAVTSKIIGKMDGRKKVDNRPIPSHWNANNAAVQCDMCGMSFLRKCSIIPHFAKAHGLDRQFSCESCPKLFRSK